MKHNRGWTLLELMIVLLVVAVLTAIAYPSYNDYLVKSRRGDGKALLYQAAQRQQQFYTVNNAYTDSVGTGGLDISGTSNEGYYTLSISATATTYTLTAEPVAPQTADAYCGQLTLSHIGVKGISGTASSADDCW